MAIRYSPLNAANRGKCAVFGPVALVSFVITAFVLLVNYESDSVPSLLSNSSSSSTSSVFSSSSSTGASSSFSSSAVSSSSSLFSSSSPVILYNNCAAEPCLNGAGCHNGTGPGNYSCSCLAGYTDFNCSTVIDNCAVVSCLHNGTCLNIIGDGTYLCNCTNSYTGPLCDAGPWYPDMNPNTAFFADSYDYFAGTVYPFPNKTAAPALTPTRTSYSTLTYNTTNFCRFMPGGDSIEEPLQPRDVWQYYITHNNTLPPLNSSQRAEVSVVLFHIEFNDTVYLQGRPINDPYWWNSTLLNGSFSFNLTSNGTVPSAQGCTVDPGLANLLKVADQNLSQWGITGASVLAADLENDFFAYARVYRNSSLPTTKMPSEYCPYYDPFPRYPIWRDSITSAFGAFSLYFPGTSRQIFSENHGFPSKVSFGFDQNGLVDFYKTCSVPYHAFLLPYSPTVDTTTLLRLAQYMLPMPADIVPNAFTLVQWTNSYSVPTDDSINVYGTDLVYDNGATVYFKQPGIRDLANSCGSINTQVPAANPTYFQDGQIIVGLTRLRNTTVSQYKPTPNGNDNMNTPIYVGTVSVGYCFSCIDPAVFARNQIFADHFLGLFGDIVPEDCTGGFCDDWPQYPQYNPCDISRSLSVAYTDEGWDPSVDPGTGYYRCGPSGAATPMFDAQNTFGYCAPYSGLTSFNYSYALTDRNGHPLVGALQFNP